jgi:hypothetical protein
MDHRRESEQLVKSGALSGEQHERSQRTLVGVVCFAIVRERSLLSSHSHLGGLDKLCWFRYIAQSYKVGV